MVQTAVAGRKTEAILRLAKAGELDHIQRVWAYTQAARLLMKSDSARVSSLLEEAADEGRRIETSDPDRARALCGIATQFVTLDAKGTWELLNEAVRAANSTEKFDGTNTQISSQLWQGSQV